MRWLLPFLSSQPTTRFHLVEPDRSTPSLAHFCYAILEVRIQHPLPLLVEVGAESERGGLCPLVFLTFFRMAQVQTLTVP